MSGASPAVLPDPLGPQEDGLSDTEQPSARGVTERDPPIRTCRMRRGFTPPTATMARMDVDPTTASPDFHPRVFISYSSAPQHNTWVLRLATRLRGNGVDVVLDQWDAALGADLPHFMEQGLAGADRVIAVCSDAYISKANAGKKGVGYEKKIMTADLMDDAMEVRIVPVIRDATGGKVTPTFLRGARYVDFRDDSAEQSAYEELLHALYGRQLLAKPPLGPNPFAGSSAAATQQQIRFDPTSFQSTALDGEIIVPYERNNGQFVLGAGERSFTVKVSESGAGSTHVYSDPSGTASIALAVNTTLEEVRPAGEYDGSSRSRTARVGDCIVMINTTGHTAAFEIIEVTTRDTDPTQEGHLRIRYRVAQ